MQRKLTITIEKNLIEQAKYYARKKGKSLSEIIENYLKTIVEEDKEKYHISPSIEKLKGSVRLPEDFDYKKNLADSLFEKYK